MSLRLDITDPDQVAAAAEIASDVTLLINNAGVTTYAPLVTGDLADVRREMETNCFGTLSMVRAFAPILAGSGDDSGGGDGDGRRGGAILNVLSVMAVPKNDPADVARTALDGVEAGQAEVIADADSASAKAPLSAR